MPIVPGSSFVSSGEFLAVLNDPSVSAGFAAYLQPGAIWSNMPRLKASRASTPTHSRHTYEGHVERYNVPQRAARTSCRNGTRVLRDDMSLCFDNQTVVITGVGQGLGRLFALHFSSNGANIVVHDEENKVRNQPSS